MIWTYHFKRFVRSGETNCAVLILTLYNRALLMLVLYREARDTSRHTSCGYPYKCGLELSPLVRAQRDTRWCANRNMVFCSGCKGRDLKNVSWHMHNALDVYCFDEGYFPDLVLPQNCLRSIPARGTDSVTCYLQR